MRPSRRAPAVLLALAAALASPACASDEGDEDLGVQTYLHNAQGYAEGGHYDQALTQFRRALALDASNRKALLGEATCLYWLGTAETPAGGRAIQEAEAKFAALDPSRFGENAWKVHLGRGMVHARLAELWDRKARRAAQEAEAGDPAAALLLKEAEGQREKADALAAADFRAVLADVEQPLAKNNLTALLFLASRSALRATDAEGFQEAMGYFQRYEVELTKSRQLWEEMKKREPSLADLYQQKLQSALRQEVELRDLMANLHFKRRDHEASIRELDRVLQIDPWRAAAFFNRGRNEEEMGRFGAAADDYRRFLKATDLPPSSALVLEASDRMARCEERVRLRMGQ